LQVKKKIGQFKRNSATEKKMGGGGNKPKSLLKHPVQKGGLGVQADTEFHRKNIYPLTPRG